MLKVTTEELKNKFENKIVISIFTQEHCFPCNIMKKAISYVEESLKDKTKMEFVNIDIIESEEFCNELKIENTPTMVVFKEGKEIFRNEGSIHIKKIKQYIAESLNIK